jgi:hypothetical protein
MPSKSKIKGSTFERDIAKFLSELYGENFHRVIGSGAFVGGTNSFRKNKLDENQVKSFKGDINAPDSWVRFNSELKSYGDFAFHQLFTGSNKMLDNWIEQCYTVSEPDDFNILIFKITRRGTFVAVESKNNSLTFSNHLVYNNPKYGQWTIMDNELFWNINKDEVRRLCQR